MEHINVKEMMAIYLALKSFRNNINSKHIKIYSGNTTAVTLYFTHIHPELELPATLKTDN
jgi:hypothetical protein